ncbi:MAG: rhodanese-like domain-containing protein [Clostridiales bacterium]|nr:rhodanese-like domain-containing protein [Clostridiales bacterium]
MKKIKRLIGATMTIAVTAALLAGCSSKSEAQPNSSSPGSYQTISPQTAKLRMDSGDDIILLDVRTEKEYKERHIPRAILIPNETIGQTPLEQLPDLNAEILVYCRSGNRSAQAAKKLAAAGYTNVYDFGGIHSWPYETVSEQE